MSPGEAQPRRDQSRAHPPSSRGNWGGVSACLLTAHGRSNGGAGSGGLMPLRWLLALPSWEGSLWHPPAPVPRVGRTQPGSQHWLRLFGGGEEAQREELRENWELLELVSVIHVSSFLSFEVLNTFPSEKLL